MSYENRHGRIVKSAAAAGVGLHIVRLLRFLVEVIVSVYCEWRDHIQ